MTITHATMSVINPDTLNKASRAGHNSVTAYIELPECYDVSDIDISTVELTTEKGAVSAQLTPTEVGDHDENSIPDLMVKFDRQEVIETVDVGDRVVVAVTGKIFYNAGYAYFGGSDTIRVIERLGPTSAALGKLV